MKDKSYYGTNDNKVILQLKIILSDIIPILSYRYFNYRTILTRYFQEVTDIVLPPLLQNQNFLADLDFLVYLYLT